MKPSLFAQMLLLQQIEREPPLYRGGRKLAMKDMVYVFLYIVRKHATAPVVLDS